MINSLKKDLQEIAANQPPPKVSFFKTKPGDYAENDQFLNIPVPILRTLVPIYKDLSLDEISNLLKSPFNEERLLALFIIIYKIDKKIISLQDGFDFYATHLDFVNNWNLVDASAHLIIGRYLLDRDRTFLFDLSQDINLWKRRISIVSTWYFIKKNDLLTTFDIAKRLLSDKEDLIHKAVGWMLREAGKKNEISLREFIKDHGFLMPRTMFRYSIEKLTDKKELMQRSSITK